MITKQRVKNQQIKRKQLILCVLLKCLNSRKQVQDHSKEFIGNSNNNKSNFFLEKPLATMIITW